MIGWLLQRLVEHPDSRFSEQELLVADAAGFKRLRGVGLLRRLPSAQSGDTTLKDGRLLTVVDTPAGGYEGVVEDDPSTLPVPLDQQDLVQWGVDVVQLARELEARNGFTGTPERIGDRTVLCGKATSQGLSVGVVLLFANEERQARMCFSALGDALAGAFDRLIVVTPGYMPGYDFQRELRMRQIVVASIDERLLVPAAALMSDRVRVMPVVELTEAQETEYRRHGFKSKDTINLTGGREARNRNVFEVNGVPARLGNAAFAHLLLLAVRLFSEDDGWTSEVDLLATGKATDIDTVLERVRKPFLSAPVGCKHTELIEKDGGRVRLSMHQRFVDFDRGALMKHPSGTIAGLAAKLPER